MNIIEGLWVISDKGIPLYNQIASSSIKNDLFSGFITAVVNFAKALGADSMDFLKLGASNFIIMRDIENSLIFVGKTNESVKIDKTKKILVKVKNKFVEFYCDILPAWDGIQTECFGSFSQVLDLEKDEDNLVQKFKKLDW